MPTSATGTRPIWPRPSPGRRRLPAAGFTLIEILVVVAIVGIVVAVAAVNLFPSNEQLARREAAEVALAIERARDGAWFGGLPTSVTLEGGRVRQWRFTGEAWSAEGQRETALSPAVKIGAVTIEGHPLRDGERLVFLSDGLGTPFRVALDVRGLPWAVEGDAAGAVRLTP